MTTTEQIYLDFFNEHRIAYYTHVTDGPLIALTPIFVNLKLKKTDLKTSRDDPLYDKAEIFNLSSDEWGTTYSYWVPMPVINGFLYRINHLNYKNKRKSYLIYRYQMDLHDYVNDVVNKNWENVSRWQSWFSWWGKYWGLGPFDDEPELTVIHPDYSKRKNIGFVYVIKSGENFKIGKTRDVPARASSLNVQLPEGLEIITTVEHENYHELESYLHSKFDSQRLNGEWFNLSEHDIEFIERAPSSKEFRSGSWRN